MAIAQDLQPARGQTMSIFEVSASSFCGKFFLAMIAALLAAVVVRACRLWTAVVRLVLEF